MADPAEHIPSDGPPGQGDGDFQFRALGLGVAGTARVGTVVELADHLHRPVQGMEVAVAVVTDRHPAFTDRAISVQDVEFPEGEIGMLGPSVWHRVTLGAVARSSDVAVRQELTLRNALTSSLLADHCLFRG